MKVNPDNTLDMEDFYAPEEAQVVEAPAPPPPPEMPEAEVEGAPVKKPRKRAAAKPGTKKK